MVSHLFRLDRSDEEDEYVGGNRSGTTRRGAGIHDGDSDTSSEDDAGIMADGSSSSAAAAAATNDPQRPHRRRFYRRNRSMVSNMASSVHYDAIFQQNRDMERSEKRLREFREGNDGSVNVVYTNDVMPEPGAEDSWNNDRQGRNDSKPDSEPLSVDEIISSSSSASDNETRRNTTTTRKRKRNHRILSNSHQPKRQRNDTQQISSISSSLSSLDHASNFTSERKTTTTFAPMKHRHAATTKKKHTLFQTHTPEEPSTSQDESWIDRLRTQRRNRQNNHTDAIVDDDESDEVLSIDMDIDTNEKSSPIAKKPTTTGPRRKKSLFTTAASSSNLSTLNTGHPPQKPSESSLFSRRSNRNPRSSMMIDEEEEEELFADSSSSSANEEESSYEPVEEAVPQRTRAPRRAIAHPPSTTFQSAPETKKLAAVSRTGEIIESSSEDDDVFGEESSFAAVQRNHTTPSTLIGRKPNATPTHDNMIRSPSSEDIPDSRKPSSSIVGSRGNPLPRAQLPHPPKKQSILPPPQQRKRRPRLLDDEVVTPAPPARRQETIEDIEEDEDDFMAPPDSAAAMNTSIGSDHHRRTSTASSAATPQTTYASPHTPFRTPPPPPPSSSTTAAPGTAPSSSSSWLQKMHSTPLIGTSSLAQDQTFPSPFSSKVKSRVGKYGKMLINSVLKIRQSHAQIQSLESHMEEEEHPHSLVLVALSVEEYYGTMSLFCKVVDPAAPADASFASQFRHVFVWKSRFEELQLAVGKHFRLHNPDSTQTTLHSQRTGVPILLDCHLLSVFNMPQDWSKRKVNAEMKKFSEKLTPPMMSNVDDRTDTRTPKQKARKNRIYTPLRGQASALEEEEEEDGSSRVAAQQDSAALSLSTADDPNDNVPLFTFPFSHLPLCTVQLEGRIQRVFQFRDLATDTVQGENVILVQCLNQQSGTFKLVKIHIVHKESNNWSELLACEGWAARFHRMHVAACKPLYQNDDDALWRIVQKCMSTDIVENTLQNLSGVSSVTDLAPLYYVYDLYFTEHSSFDLVRSPSGVGNGENADDSSQFFAPFVSPPLCHKLRDVCSAELPFNICGRLLFIVPVQSDGGFSTQLHTPVVYLQDDNTRKVFCIHLCDVRMVRYLKFLVEEHLEMQQTTHHGSGEKPLRLEFSNLLYSSDDGGGMIYTSYLSTVCNPTLRDEHQSQQQQQLSQGENFTQSLTQSDPLTTRRNTSASNRSKGKNKSGFAKLPPLRTTTDAQGTLSLDLRKKKHSTLHRGQLYRISLSKPPQVESVRELGTSATFEGCPHCRNSLSHAEHIDRAMVCEQCHQSIGTDTHRKRSYFCVYMVLNIVDGLTESADKKANNGCTARILLSHEDVLNLLGYDTENDARRTTNIKSVQMDQLRTYISKKLSTGREVQLDVLLLDGTRVRDTVSAEGIEEETRGGTASLGTPLQGPYEFISLNRFEKSPEGWMVALDASLWRMASGVSI